MTIKCCRLCHRPAVDALLQYCERHAKRRVASNTYIRTAPENKGSRGGGKRRNSAAVEFYNSSRWHNLRKEYLTEDNMWCIACANLGNLTLATDVDHIIPRKIKPELQWEESNFQPLCKQCHLRKSAKDKRGLYADFRNKTFIVLEDIKHGKNSIQSR